MGKNKKKPKLSDNVSIREWLVIPTLFVLVLAIAVVGVILVRSSVNNLQLVLDELQENIEEQVGTGIQEKLFLAEQLNKTNHAMFEAKILTMEPKEVRELYFYNMLKSYPDAAMSFIGLKDGSFYGARRNPDGEIYIARNDESTGGASFYYSASPAGLADQLKEEFPDFDPRTRPWYKVASKTGVPSYSEVYIHFVFHEPTITASQPVYDEEGELLGVFGVNYLLSWLNGLLGSLLIGEEGQIVLTDSEGYLLASTLGVDVYETDGESIKLVKLDEAENIYLKKLSEEIDKETEPARELEGKRQAVKIEGSKYFVGSLNLQHKNLDWKLYYLVSENDFFGEVNKSIKTTIILLGLAVIASVAASSFVARRIAIPIEKLSRASEKLLEGDLELITGDEKISELSTLTNSFNRMGKRLTGMMAGLEKQVELRTEELELANSKLKRLSGEDDLTGTCNRRRFDEAYGRAWQAAVESKSKLGLFIIDIDYFKKYNDTYGHLKGDACLKAIATSLETSLRRTTDLMARYGGEEFVVLVKDVDESAIFDFADRLRQAIESLNIEHRASEFSRVTVSIGVSYVVPQEGLESSVLMSHADRALYRAKEGGRNRVCLINQGDKTC